MLVPAKSGVGSGSSATTGFRKVWNVMTDGGCVGNNSTSDTANLAAADAIAYANGWQLYFPKPTGQYLVSGTVTFLSHCTFDVGAIIHSTSGSVTFNGGVTADITQILNLDSGVTASFSPAKTNVGYAEWWGAAINNSAVDSSPAINSALIACRTVQLLPGTYYCASVINHSTAGHVLQGAPHYSYLVFTVDTSNGVNMNGGSRISHLYIYRTVGPNIASACIGLYVEGGYDVENIVVDNFMIGIKIWKTGLLRFDNSRSVRTLNGTGVGTNSWIGVFFNGTTYTPGPTGGNASLYAYKIQCVTTTAYTGTSTAYYANLGIADLFLDSLECEGCTTGFQIVGQGNTASTFINLDVQLSRLTFEAKNPFVVSGLNKMGSIEVNGGYFLPFSTNPAVSITDSIGSITFNQILYAMVNTTSDCISISNSSNVSSVNGHVIECQGAAIVLVNSSNCYFADRITNNVHVGSGVTLTNSSRNQFYCKMTGAYLGSGYKILDTLSAYNEFNCTGLDPTGITGGAANKLVINGTQVTVVGIAAAGSGNNVASGVMA
jgi:hypothetical protein